MTADSPMPSDHNLRDSTMMFQPAYTARTHAKTASNAKRIRHFCFRIVELMPILIFIVTSAVLGQQILIFKGKDS
jgi:hypothetical protein